jgi:hypothetical protein
LVWQDTDRLVGRPAHAVAGEAAHLKQLDISVKQVTLRDVDLLQAQLMH